MNHFKLALIFSLLITSSAYSQVGYMLDANAFYFQKEEQRSNSDGTQTIDYETQYLFLGLGVCYKTGEWCFGLKYLTGEIGNKNNNGLIDGSIELEGIAASFGYVAGSIVAQASYFIPGAEKRFGDAGFGGDTSTEYPAKTAYMLDLGYGFHIGSVSFGPNIKIFKFTYDERKVNGQTESLVREESDQYLLPMFSIWTFF